MTPSLRRSLALLLLGLMLPLSAGCPTVPAAGVQQFGQSVSAVRAQTDTAFGRIGQVVQEDQIDTVLKQTKIGEKDLLPILSYGTIERYHRVFDQLSSYTQNLSDLTSPDRPKEFGDSMVTLGQSMKQLDRNSLPNVDVATAVTALGEALIKAKAQADALKIARETDPAVQKVCQTMAQAIRSGKTPDTGLWTNIADHWNNRLKAIRTEFAMVKPDAADAAQQKRAIIDRYLAGIQQQDADLLALDMLAQSYLQLGQAHAALAQGQPLGVAGALDLIKNELKTTQDLFDKFTELKKKESTTTTSNNGATNG